MKFICVFVIHRGTNTNLKLNLIDTWTDSDSHNVSTDVS